MPSVIDSGDEFADLPDATENGGTQALYGISQHRAIVEEGGEGWGSGAFSQKSLLRLRLVERQNTPVWNVI